jgi:hypothetical protein
VGSLSERPIANRAVAGDDLQWHAPCHGAEFRELFEVNFARFDAKLERRLAEAKAELRTEMHAGFAQLRGETATGLGTLRSELASARGELLKWMCVYWAGSVVTTVGLVLAAASLLRS